MNVASCHNDKVGGFKGDEEFGLGDVYNDHCLCNESQGVRRQVRLGGCDIGIVSRISGKTMDRFQCTWIAMIDKMYKLIAKYLGNGFR